MPLYEYECDECGKIEEVVQKFSDAPLKKCNCCSGKLRKLISNSSFLLKGGGWYVTDYGASHNSSRKKKEDQEVPSKPTEKKDTNVKADKDKNV